MLHLVGETIDRVSASRQSERGTLIQIVRGVYVDASADVDAVLIAHAVRIAAYLYPQTYLSGDSAVRAGPTADGRLFLAGRRGQRTRLRELEIVQTRAPSRPEVENVTVKDPLGALTVRRSALPFRFLEAFRTRSEAGTAIGLSDKKKMAKRLRSTASDEGALLSKLWQLALANGWKGEAAEAERFLHQPLRPSPTQDTVFHVGWHGDTIGRLVHDGTGWAWTPDRRAKPNPVRGGPPGALPPFIESLLPEGWLEDVLAKHDELELLSSGKRYLSNIAVVTEKAALANAAIDILQGRLGDWSSHGRFTGRYAGPEPGFDASLADRMAEAFAGMDLPRLSGVQIKMPMTLAEDGRLTPADRTPFTHILKPAPGAGFEALPVIEHACLHAASACGFDVPAHALVSLPGGLPDALLIERFDIRTSFEDGRRLALEDFASIKGVPSARKYEGSIEQAARAYRSVSTDWQADAETLLRRTVFAWLIADGDMHLKNIAALKMVEPGAKSFTSVRLSPVYDAVTTRVFPNLAHDDMALAANGKRARLSCDDFVQTGTTMGLPTGSAERAVAQVAEGLRAHLGRRTPATESSPLEAAYALWRERLDAL